MSIIEFLNKFSVLILYLTSNTSLIQSVISIIIFSTSKFENENSNLLVEIGLT